MATKIAFVSCAYAAERTEQPAWTEILAAEPDLLLLMGDNAYMSWDGPQWDFAELETCYRKQAKVPGYGKLVETVPTLAIWDDHDCGPNDTNGAEIFPERLATSREKFDRWLGFARNNNRPHMYCTYNDLPDVKVIMLDVRTHRTSSTGANPTVLGQTQEQWLWERLDGVHSPQARITLVVSGTPYSKGAPGQRLMDYPQFAGNLRQRLGFRPGNAPQSSRRALLLAGDVHYNAVIPHQTERFYEVLSSGVACFNPGTYLDMFSPDRHSDNWGLITIDNGLLTIDMHGNPKTEDPKRPNNFSRTIRIEDWTILPP